MWDPFHSLPRAAFFVSLPAAIQAHGVLLDSTDPFLMVIPSISLIVLVGGSAWSRSVVRRDPPDRMRARCKSHAIGNSRLLLVVWSVAGLFLGLWGAVLWIERTLWRMGLSETPFGDGSFLMPVVGASFVGVALWYQFSAIPRSRRFLARLRSEVPPAGAPGAAGA